VKPPSIFSKLIYVA